MPHFSAFVGENAEAEYASTTFHELVHAVGHPSRLDRKFSSKIFKFLVAELGAALCCAKTGYDYSAVQSPAYIDHWLKVLKADNRAIFGLASLNAHPVGRTLLLRVPKEKDDDKDTAEQPMNDEITY